MCNLHWCYTFCTGVTLFALVLHLNCIALSQSEWSNFFMYIIKSVIILVINKSDSRCAVVRFCYHLYDYRQNWTPLSPITITYYRAYRHEHVHIHNITRFPSNYAQQRNKGLFSQSLVTCTLTSKSLLYSLAFLFIMYFIVCGK